eukprot:UN04226
MCCSQLYDYQIDTWALGCITAELYTRKAIFKGRNHIEQLQYIFYFMGTPTDLSWITSEDAKEWIANIKPKQAVALCDIIPNASKLAQDFIAKLLIINPHRRPDISSAIGHLWMKEFAIERDYVKCPVFNISFEYESSIKTVFGIRHMMYKELHDFHGLCEKRQQERMQIYQERKQQIIVKQKEQDLEKQKEQESQTSD